MPRRLAGDSHPHTGPLLLHRGMPMWGPRTIHVNFPLATCPRHASPGTTPLALFRLFPYAWRTIDHGASVAPGRIGRPDERDTLLALSALRLPFHPLRPPCRLPTIFSLEPLGVS